MTTVCGGWCQGLPAHRPPLQQLMGLARQLASQDFGPGIAVAGAAAGCVHTQIVAKAVTWVSLLLLPSGEMPHAPHTDHQPAPLAVCSRGPEHELDSQRFAKLCKECGLSDRRFSPGYADVTFTLAKKNKKEQRRWAAVGRAELGWMAGSVCGCAFGRPGGCCIGPGSLCTAQLCYADAVDSCIACS